MEEIENDFEVFSDYKLVPWSSWDQWKFVHESIFSSDVESVAAALRKVAAWRSRGCLPVAIDITAAIIEIQQKDPYFRDGICDKDVNSEEMLAMLYCMSIMRLVNGFVERSHKKTGRSISELADAIGIPRMLVDIRHESSHRGLPSIRLVRLASTKAINWLKSHYWEPQYNAIPDIHREIKSKLLEMIDHLKAQNSQEPASQSKGRCNMKQISKISKFISRLCSAYHSDVALVLLENFQVHTSDLSNEDEMENSDDVKDDQTSSASSIEVLKTIINRLSRKRPKLLLSIVKFVIETIESKEHQICEKEKFAVSVCKADELHQITRLRSLLPWLLSNLKALKDSGLVILADGSPEFSLEKGAPLRVSLVKLLHKCLALYIPGEEYISESVFLLAKMIGNNLLTQRLQNLPLYGPHKPHCSDTNPIDSASISREENFIKQATEKLKLLKSHLRDPKVQDTDPGGSNAETNIASTDSKKHTWKLSKSWTPCPIGMLPCSFSSTETRPDLDIQEDKKVTSEAKVSDDKANLMETNKRENSGNVIETNMIDDESLLINGPNKRRTTTELESVVNAGSTKRLRQIEEVEKQDIAEMNSLMKGRLMINGIWKKVNEEEMIAIQSEIRILVN